MSSQYYIAPYNNSLNYTQFDVVYGIYNGVNAIDQSPYFYATQNITPGSYSPSGRYSFPLTAYSLTEDIVTLTYTHTGGPPFAPGSIIAVTGVTANTAVNYTGMVLIGGSGTLSYVAPGWSQGGSLSVGAINCLNPAWTTGFMFQPTYTTKVGTTNSVITAQLGDGYTQTQPQGINTFQQNVGLVFQNRGKREVKAMTNFVQDHAGGTFEILIPDQFLDNQPNQKWMAPSVEVTPVSFGLYDAQVTVVRRFDP